MSSSAGNHPTDNLPDHPTPIYDTVRSPVQRYETPSKTTGGYVTHVGNFQTQFDQHYLNVKHFREVTPSFQSKARKGIEGQGRLSGVLAPLSPVQPALPSKGNWEPEARYHSTPKALPKIPGYAELRTASPPISSASPEGLSNIQSPKSSEFDSPRSQSQSMGNTPPTVQAHIKRAALKPRWKHLDTPTVTPRSSSHHGSTEETTWPLQDDGCGAKPGQALMDAPVSASQLRKSRVSTEFLKEVHTPDPVLDKVLRQCQTAMESYAAQAADGQIIFTGGDFACGMFDHRGGFLPLPDHKICLYVTPHAIVGDYPEPIFLYIHPDPPEDVLDLEKGEKPISPTIVCGKTGLKFSSDVVLSFPVKSQDLSSTARYQVIVSEQSFPSEKPKQQTMDKILDCFFSVDDGRCTMMVNQLGCFTVVSRPPRNTDDFRFRYTSQPSEELVNFRVGVFGRQLIGTGSAQIRVIFWKDTDEETHRIVSEETQDRFRKLDRVRVVAISKYRKAVWVTANHVIPGWTLLTKNKERLSVERLISQLRKDGCLPSCTFALYRDAGGFGSAQTPRVASCTIEVSQEGGYADEDEEENTETVQFVAVVDEEESTAPVIPPRPPILAGGRNSPKVPDRAPLSQKAGAITFKPLLKPPAGLRHKTLGELSLHLEVSVISGRGWKLLAQKMGLSAPHICCLRERYLCPGQALLNLYLGQQAALVPIREALRRLLDLFRDMDWPELQTILMREIQNTDNKDPGHDWSLSHPRCYEIIDEETSQSMKSVEETSDTKSSPGLPRRNSYEALSRIPIPSPRSSPKPAIKRQEIHHQAPMSDTDNQTSESQDVDRLRRSPFNQKVHFTSSGTDKIISPASSPTGYFYQAPVTQLPKLTLRNKIHGALPHKMYQSGVPPKTEDEGDSISCPDTEKQEAGFEKQIPLLPPKKDATEAAAEEENPYLRPNVKDKVAPPPTINRPHSIRSPQMRFNKEAPLPPQRTTSVRVRTRPPQFPQVSQRVEAPTLQSVPDLPSVSDKHERESDQNDIYECHQVPDQTPAEEEQPQLASSLQLKKKLFQDLLKKKLHNVLKLAGREEADDPEVQPQSISLEGSIPDSIYDDVAILLQEDQELAMMQEEPGGRQLVERILKSSAVTSLLSKIPHNISRKKIQPFPEELKALAATNDMDCYEDISGPEIPARAEPDTQGAVARKTVADVKPYALTDDMTCYEEINEPEFQTRATGLGRTGAAARKPLPVPPTSYDQHYYEDTASLRAPTRTGSEKFRVKTTSGEVKMVRKFTPKARAVPPTSLPPKPQETYEVMPIGQGGVQRL